MGLLRKLFGKGSVSPIERSPMSSPERKSEGGGIELKSGDPIADAMRAVFFTLETLCGHPVTSLRAVDLVPVSPTLAEELERIERAQFSQALASADPAEVEREVEALQEQVAEQSDDARLWLRGVAWDARREAAVALFRLGMVREESGIPAAVRGYTILATAAVRDSDPDRRVDAIVALKRVMLDTSAETFEMRVPLMAGFLLCWLLAEDPDERIRLAASWALGGIPYRSVSAPVGWLSSWLILREAGLVREGRIEMPDDLRRQLFALAAQAEAAHGEWLVKMSRQAGSKPPRSSGQDARDGQKENPVVVLLTHTPVGGALFARFPFPEEDGGMQTALIIHESAEHVQNLPATLDIQERSVFFEEQGVGLLAVMYRIGGEMYETWWNYHNPSMRQSIDDLQHQPRLCFMFFDDSLEPSRVVWAPNGLQTVFAAFAGRAGAMTPWSMPAFDAARAQVYARYPTLGALWKKAQGAGHHLPPRRVAWRRRVVILIVLALVALAIGIGLRINSVGNPAGLLSQLPLLSGPSIPTEAAVQPTPMPTPMPVRAGVSTPIPKPTLTPTATSTRPPSPAACAPNAAFVQDVTVPDGTQLKPAESFSKTWRLRSNGCAPWETGTRLVFVSGDQLGAPEAVDVLDTRLKETADISVPMRAPDAPGTYKSTWQMQGPDGRRFGDIAFVVIVVPGQVATPTPAACPPNPALVAMINELEGSLTLVLEGPQNYRLLIPAGQTQNICVEPGTYSYTASGSGYASEAGHEAFDAGDPQCWWWHAGLQVHPICSAPTDPAVYSPPR